MNHHLQTFVFALPGNLGVQAILMWHCLKFFVSVFTKIVSSSCIAQEQEPDGRSSRFFDRQISFSSLPNKLDAVTGSPEKPPTKLYEFQVGAFDPLSSARTRKSWNPGAGKSSLRKPTVHQSTSSGLKWDTSNEKLNCVQPRSRRVCFSPEEVTSGFSFRPVTSKGVRYPGNIHFPSSSMYHALSLHSPFRTRWHAKFSAFFVMVHCCASLVVKMSRVGVPWIRMIFCRYQEPKIQLRVEKPARTFTVTRNPFLPFILNPPLLLIMSALVGALK